MGRAHAQFAALMHEAAHRLLFRNRKVNDWVGRWLLGYPSFTPIDLYRRGHMAHHREEFGPGRARHPALPRLPDPAGLVPAQARTGRNRPDRLEAVQGTAARRTRTGRGRHPGAPHRRSAARAHRRLRSPSDIRGSTGCCGSLRTSRCGASSTGCDPSPSTAGCAARRTGGRRPTRYGSRWAARFALVPFHIGWHLAHHVDSGVPMRQPARNSTPSSARPDYVTEASNTRATGRCGGVSRPAAEALAASGRDAVHGTTAVRRRAETGVGMA